ncbi:MAG: TRAP transporter small permease [Desulfobacteraceae bacterium]|uniref:TRAP transporter small permease n=1 Tax=Candidatus Desulfacyla euxinica TaxID=2841693 RepID=A0A8J6N1V3_9DELT|nr:TRAP transporter small permease [Candidatus Desulfacyla euxinica]MBL6977640.1 TRAP transporter small permease [Desulfobacteraceae bacterium]
MKINRIILGFEKCLIVILFTFMFTVTFAQVIARYFFNTGWAWVPETAVLACITLTYIGASTGVKSGVHIGVDVIVKLLPVRFQRYSDVFADFCGLVLYLFMSYISLQFILYFKKMGQLSIITGFPIWVMICYMPVGFFLMAVHHTESLWERSKAEKLPETRQ